MPNLDGQPSAAQIIKYCDPFASIFKKLFPSLGLDAPGETGTAAVLGDSARAIIMGDGNTNAGLGLPGLQARIDININSAVRQLRADGFFANFMQPYASPLDNQVGSYLPSGWVFQPTINQAHQLDFWLTRLNAIAVATPATPTAAPTLTAINDANGAMPSVVVGSAPRIVFCFVGALDYNESLPSAEIAQLALSGSLNGYSLAIAGVVPAGVFKVRIYRGLVGGLAGGPYYWSQDAVVVPGAAFSAIKILNADAALRTDITPPSWMSCLMTPEWAAMFALASANSGASSTGVGTGAPVFTANGMLSPNNVAIGPVNGFVGLGNQANTAEFGNSTVTAANTQTWAANSIQAANNPAQNVQGYAGAAGFRARVTTPLNGSCTPTVSYTYLDATHGPSNVQTQAGVAGSAFATGLAGDTSTFVVPAGRLVLTVTVTAVAGTATAGVMVIEATPVRAY